MKALVKTAKGKGNIEIREVPHPDLPGDDWVIIRVKAAGVCGSDLHIWKDEFPYWPPVVMGHEFSGIVAETGSKVTNVKTGDRVVAEPHSLACGLCELCRQGKPQICPDKRSPGWGIDGAFTEYVAMPCHLLHQIPEGMSFEYAALAEPAAIAVHQVHERGKIDLGDTVVITGAGPMGLLSTLVARECGAGTIIITGMSSCGEVRFPAAEKLGADRIVNVEQEDPVEVVLDITKGRGADIVVETSGAPAAIRQTAAMVRKCGRISAIGLTGNGEVSFLWNEAMHKVVDVLFNFSSSYTSWDRALSVLAHTDKDVDSIITHRTQIDNWESVFKDLVDEKGIKALFINEEI